VLEPGDIYEKSQSELSGRWVCGVPNKINVEQLLFSAFSGGSAFGLNAYGQ
jgi:hypothetical protein